MQILAGAKWIGEKSGEILPLTGHITQNLEEQKDKITVRSYSILLRKTFFVDRPLRSAEIQVCGLGLYKLFVNGKRAGLAALAPLQTNYRERVFYDTIAIDHLLKIGKNVLLLEVGTGWYAAPRERWDDWRMSWFGNPRAILRAELMSVDGELQEIGSDKSFRLQKGPVIKSCIYGGEIYDACRMPKGVHEPEFDDSGWPNAQEVEPPSKRLMPAQGEEIRVCGSYEAEHVTQCTEGILYDFGRNRSGRIRLCVSGKAGSKVTIRHCEQLDQDGEPNYITNHGAEATDVYILAGGMETYVPEFTYHGFQYAVLTLSDSSIKIHSVLQEHIHSAVRTTGSFETDLPQLNKIHQACTLTQLNGLMGHPIDCPQRAERLGWLGDAHVMAEACLYNFDMRRVYEKWLDDIYYDCDPETGAVPHIAPWPQWCEKSPADWCVGYLIVAMACYRMYGDSKVLERHFDKFEAYLKYLESESDDFILPRGKYGDWASSKKDFQRGDPYYDNTMFYYYALQIIEKCADILGYAEKRKNYAKKAALMRKRCLELYYNAEEKCFGKGDQFSDSFALLLGLVPDDEEDLVFEHLLWNIQEESGGHLIGGIFGTQYVMEVLRRFDRGDIAVDLMLKEGYPSWLDMLEGYNTITECWRWENNDYHSLNHGMLGSVDVQFYKILGGVEIDMTANIPIKIRPYVTDYCGQVQVKLETVWGNLLSAWINSETEIKYYLEIPEGVKAQFCVSDRNFYKDLELDGLTMAERFFELESGFHKVVLWKA